MQNFKGSKPSKIIKVYSKGSEWDTDIYVRPYPRNKLSTWMKELRDDTGEHVDPITKVFHMMSKFCGGCLCDDTGELIADDSQETIDFLLGMQDDSILLELYRQSSKVSGLTSVADGLLSAFEEEETAEEKPNRKKRRAKQK